MDIARVTDWTPAAVPTEADASTARPPGTIRWLELDAPAEAAEQLTAELAPQCPGLTAEMLEDLLSPDDEPTGNVYDGGRVKLASSCAISTRAEPKERRGSADSVGGLLVIAPVELLAGEDWILSCWHSERVFH